MEPMSMIPLTANTFSKFQPSRLVLVKMGI